ncbi:hypothetical protein K491DRAFT_711801 [Lophiostoma macrostomum CBS 122681]|uniref:F-box domain-containing protein n=1 Tax=Lophiostoma macrostomum CBS 122681 TaxID=1314788 RepID=A0A6A6TNX5_9PLEO|nr:hypothetical protein K491DRAFT_711801 [Lophiostoma macrostomum CBS 122681]
MGNTPILRLPDEILLCIITRLRIDRKYGDEERNKHVFSVMLVCRQFHPIAQEVLLAQPFVRLLDVRGLVRMYVKYPQLAAAVSTLEVTATRNVVKSRDPEDGSLYDFHAVGQEFEEACQGIIDQQRLSDATKEDWNDALEIGSTHAFMGLLLVLLPNLKCLLLGTARLHELPILGSILDTSHHFFDIIEAEALTYSREVMRLVAPRIQELELPRCWPSAERDDTHRGLNTGACIRNMKPFRDLRTLIIPRRAFFGTTPRSFPVFGLEPLLEHVVILDDILCRSTGVLKELLEEKDSLPALQKIGLYFEGSEAKFKLSDNPTYNGLRKLGASLGVEVHNWHVGDVFDSDEFFSHNEDFLRPWLYNWMELAELEIEAHEAKKESCRTWAEYCLQAYGKINE